MRLFIYNFDFNITIVRRFVGSSANPAVCDELSPEYMMIPATTNYLTYGSPASSARSICIDRSAGLPAMARGSPGALKMLDWTLTWAKFRTISAILASIQNWRVRYYYEHFGQFSPLTRNGKPWHSGYRCSQWGSCCHSHLIHNEF